MKHLHEHGNNDVLIYNIKYIDEGRYIARFATRNEVNLGDVINSKIIRLTTNSFFGGSVTQLIKSKSNNQGYFVNVAEITDETFSPDFNTAVNMNEKHLDLLLTQDS